MPVRLQSDSSENDTADANQDSALLARRLFERGKIPTPSGVELVVERYGSGSIPVLVRSLNQDSVKTTDLAFEKLKMFGDAGFRALCQAAVDERNQLQIAIIKYLGRWGDPRAVEFIVRATEADSALQTKKKVGKITLFTLLGVAAIVAISALCAAAGADSLPCEGCYCGGGSKSETGTSGGSCFACEEAESVQLKRQAVASLAAIDSAKAVSALTQLVRDSNNQVNRSARYVLFDILSRTKTMEEREIVELGKDGALRLAEMLTTENVSMSEAILITLRHTPDPRVITVLQKYSNDRRKPRHLRSYAFDSLSIIRQRIADEDLRLSLLRGADYRDQKPAEELLRASGMPNVEPESELLRASVNDLTT